jgi:indolepyruvate ferredoxin oxidoreductase alpha subunit
MSRQGIYKASFAETSVRYADEYLSDTVDTNNIMGGGIGFAQGQFWTGYNDGLILAVTGDSTFFHACIPSLINAVWNKAKFPFIILDNSWTAMTGHQPHPGTGMVGVGEQSKEIKIEEICKACGVENIRIVDSYDVVATRDAIEDAIKSNEFSVVISRRKCALQALRRKELGKRAYEVDQDLCVGCRECIRLGCPALNFDYEGKKARIGGEIAALSCLGCGVCEQVCPSSAIKMKGDYK